MSRPGLPNVDALVDQVLARIGASDGGVLTIQGPPAAGKSTALRRLETRLRASGNLPVRVSPPRRQMDSGGLALIEAGESLRGAGAINGEFSSLFGSPRPWAATAREVGCWIEKPDNVVLLCDEPTTWRARRGDPTFGEHAQDAALELIQASRWTVITGPAPAGVSAIETLWLQPGSEDEGWLEAHNWGPLSETSGVVQSLPGISDRTPLEVRLLVALTHLLGGDEVRRWWDGQPSRRDLSTKLAEQLESDEEGPRYIRRAWGRIALVRRSVTPDLVDRLAGQAPDEPSRALVHNCILYPSRGRLVLHEMLRLDAIQRRWLDRAELANTHAEICAWYSERVAGNPLERPIEEAEALYHAQRADDPILMQGRQPFFIDQLRMWGRTLSYHLQAHEDAANVFTEILEKWDSTDDYAHHYLAYNLDWIAKRPDLVEEHYQEAIRLEPRYTWWWSRWICYLITRGDNQRARAEWARALDTLGIPDPDNDDAAVYENLHVWVARLLVHRGELAFAQAVLDAVPADIRGGNRGLRAIHRRLVALVEAQRDRVVFPLEIPPEAWWEGPRALPTAGRNGGRLAEWAPARVDRITDSIVTIVLRGPVPVGADGSTTEFATSEVPAGVFDEYAEREIRFSDLIAGTFLEFGWFEGDDGHARVRRLGSSTRFFDEDLPRFDPPDTTRYLRSSELVIVDGR